MTSRTNFLQTMCVVLTRRDRPSWVSPWVKRAENFTSRITDVHRLFTTEPVVAGNHFAVGREVDVTVQGHGRIQINEIMLYEVKDGEIVLEQFIY